MKIKLTVLIPIALATLWFNPNAVANNPESTKMERSTTQPYVPDEVKNRYKQKPNSKYIHYHGKIDPLSMPKPLILKSFLSRIQTAKSNEHLNTTLNQHYQLIGLSRQSQLALQQLSSKLKQQEQEQKNNNAEVPQLCKLLSNEKRQVSPEEVASFINDYRSTRQDIYINSYQNLNQIIPSNEIDIFEQYLVTVYAKQLTFSIRKPLTSEDIRIERLKNMCNRRKK